jgi:hypothetical protein
MPKSSLDPRTKCAAIHKLSYINKTREIARGSKSYSMLGWVFGLIKQKTPHAQPGGIRQLCVSNSII